MLAPSFRRFLFIGFVCFWAGVSTAAAQGTTASLVGTVYDPSLAIVPGVDVTATHVDTGTSRMAVSNEAGRYTLRNLPIGRYLVTAELPGFKKAEVTDIILLLDQTAQVDLHLETGEISEIVTVEGSAQVLLNKTTSDVGEVIQNKRIVELPLNQREFLQLARLAPGVIQSAPGSVEERDVGPWGAIQSSGLRTMYTTTLIHGLSNNDPQNNMLAARPSVDAIQEFKIQTSNFSAETASRGGAVVSIAIKSGTNRFHGSLFAFNRNGATAARNFFEPDDSPNLNQNQFGGTIGGPIIKDKTFFFFAVERRTIRRPSPVIGVVPTLEQRQGVFDPDRFGLIYDPLTWDPETLTRQPFPNNTIPSNRISSISQDILGLVHLPNSADPLRNYQAGVTNTDDMTQYNVRVDHNFGDRATLMFSFSVNNIDRLFLGTLPPFIRGGTGIGVGGIQFADRHRQYSGAYTHILSPVMTNEFRFGAIRFSYNRTGQNNGRTPTFENEWGIPGTETRTDFVDFPAFRVTGYDFPSERTQSVYRNTIFQAGDHFSWVKGDHSFKVGIELHQINSNFQQCACAGDYRFSGIYTSAGQAAPEGDAFAQFLLGNQGVSGGSGMSRWEIIDQGYLYGHQVGLYFQDDWRVNDKLTLNLGLRYDYAKPMKDKNDHISNWDPTDGFTVFPEGYVPEECDPITGECVPFDSPFPFKFSPYGRNIYQGDRMNLGPRLGFAYQMSPDLVLRGAYGIFHAAQMVTRHEVLANFNPPFLFFPTIITDPDVPNSSFEQGFAGPDLNRSAFAFGWAPKPFRDLHNPYAQMWNVGLQVGLSSDLMLDLAYVGSKGTHATARKQLNIPDPGPGAIQPRRPFPDSGRQFLFTDELNSTYNSVQVKLNKRYTEGLAFNMAYTWSKSIDNNSGDGGFATDSGNVIENSFRIHESTRGRSAFDLPHRFVLNYIWELPGPETGAIRHLAGGWQMTGLWTMQSGWPFTPSTSSRTNNNEGGRPDRICDGGLSNPTADRWFDVGCFTTPEIYTYGNSGRTILRADNVYNFDLGLFKNFPIVALGEQARLQFRAEFFNLFNHANFGAPQRNIRSGSAGAVTTAAFGREIQFGLKLIF
jgi:outer membrane receptor protein involved in Fe transport